MEPTAHTVESVTDHYVGGGDIELTSLKTSHSTKQAKPTIDESPSAWLCEILFDWMVTILIGFLVVSYWRGTWVLMDLYTCQQPTDATLIRGDTFCYGVEYANQLRVKTAWISYLVGNGLLAIGIYTLWAGWWIPKTNPPVVSLQKAFLRSIMVYIFGAATVCIWRGIWYMTDYLILPNDALQSWWTTTICGMVGAYLAYASPSLLAPPAMFNMDGPGLCPPPLAVTILSSYYSITHPLGKDVPLVSKWACFGDIVLSFVILPVFVVWFWRGCWLLLDYYLWGLTPEIQDLHLSLVYGAVLAMGLLGLGSDDLFSLIPEKNILLSQVAGRIRTIPLAVGAVSFWRVVWLLWDEILGGTSYWSAWLAHITGVVGLLVLGCLSCITAPPTTLGVDAVAHEDTADEPLFQDVPIPAETVFLFGIGRQKPEPDVVLEKAASLSSMSFDAPSTLLERQRPELSSAGSARLSRESITSLSQRHIQKRARNQFFRSRNFNGGYLGIGVTVKENSSDATSLL